MNQSQKSNIFIRILRQLNRWITALRNLFFNLLFIVIIIAIWVSVSNQSSKGPKVASSGVLELNLTGYLTDVTVSNQIFNQFALEQFDENTALLPTIHMIVQAAEDNKVKAIVINSENLLSASLSQVKELGEALLQFRASGKPVFAYGNYFSQSQFLLASYADEVWLHPDGAVELIGLSIYRNYYKDALDKIKLKFDVFRSGNFKSAPDAFVESQMPEPIKQRYAKLIEDLWSSALEPVVSERPTDFSQLERYVKTLDEELAKFDGDLAQLAESIGLVDQLAYRDEFDAMLVELVGEDSDNKMKPYKRISMHAYLNEVQSIYQHNAPIAVIAADGAIYDGQGLEGIASDRLVETIRNTRLKKHTKAIVLRINSPGGSSLASEKIRRELELARQDDIKVWVSMSSVAASGGYWIAMGSDNIWASPDTITGSIGVFGMRPDASQSMRELGINNDGVATSELSEMYYIERPLSDKSKKVFQLSVDSIYNKFTNLVATSRQMEIDTVQTIADGRIYSGKEAKQNGLIDNLGGYLDVLAMIKQEIDSDEVRIVMPQIDWFEQLKGLGMSDLIQMVTKDSLPTKTLQQDLQLLKLAEQSQFLTLCLDCQVR